MSSDPPEARPLLMCGPMVLSTLEGVKTQTRRVVLPLPIVTNEGSADPSYHLPKGRQKFVYCDKHGVRYQCPYGRPGDRLWVRETFGLVPATAYGHTVAHRHDPDDPSQVAIYVAGWERVWETPKRPSIFMPRWASRLTLEITDIRIQRVQDITEEDVFAEGIGPDPADMDDWSMVADTREEFVRLWDGLNARRGFGWHRNPWVWAISFRKVETK